MTCNPKWPNSKAEEFLLTLKKDIETFFTSLPDALKMFTVFEDFDEGYNIILSTNYPWEDSVLSSEIIRTATASVSAAMARRSLHLERLFASFIVDAEDLFKTRRPHWVWQNLKSLALTSRLLTYTVLPGYSLLESIRC